MNLSIETLTLAHRCADNRLVVVRRELSDPGCDSRSMFELRREMMMLHEAMDELERAISAAQVAV